MRPRHLHASSTPTCSFCSIFSINSGASGHSSSPFGSLKIAVSASTAFLRTYEWRCSRLAITGRGDGAARTARVSDMAAGFHCPALQLRRSGSPSGPSFLRATSAAAAAAPTRGHQRLQQLLLMDAAEEAQRDTPDVLVGVLQVVAQVLADQDLRAGGGGGQGVGG